MLMLTIVQHIFSQGSILGINQSQLVINEKPNPIG